MLMSPVVNGDSPAAQCATQGYVAGFINTEDFNGPTDPNSNTGEAVEDDDEWCGGHRAGDWPELRTALRELRHLAVHRQSSWAAEDDGAVVESILEP